MRMSECRFCGDTNPGHNCTENEPWDGLNVLPPPPEGFRWCPDCLGDGSVDNPEYSPQDDATTQVIPCERCRGEGVIPKE